MSGRQRETPGSEAPPRGGRRPPRVNLISLGCPKNLVDSEMILGNAGLAGFEITPSADDADVLVINTCGFIDQAREESVNTILEACEIKRSSSTPKRVVVTGCLGQRHGDELRREIPEIDAVVGLGQYDGIGAVLHSLLEIPVSSDGAAPALSIIGDPDFACNAETGRLRLTPSHYAYVRISEGCDNPCTFCSIPSIRGRFRSKPIPRIEEEVRELAASGCREVILISQDSTSYGTDLDGTYQLPRLLEAVAAIDGVVRVRLLYVYPACFSDEMIDAIAAIPEVLPYVDIPLQHITERMLRRMGRRLGERATRGLLERMRERIPGLFLRTTFIAGFPGEDDEEFEALRRFVEEFRFERLGVFPFSREEGTPAARLDGAVPAGVIAARVEELMLTQQQIAFEQNRRRVGERVEVILDAPVEEPIPPEGGATWAARSAGEAPEIDPVILVEDSGSGAPARWSAGDLVTVRISGTRGYDLIARP